MPSNHLILCHPLLLLPSIFPSIRVFSNESTLRIRWPKYWSFSFNISLHNEHPGLVSFRMDWLDLLTVQGRTQESSQTPQFKSINSSAFSFLYSPTLTSTHDYWKNHSFDYTNVCQHSDIHVLICCLGMSWLFSQGASVLNFMAAVSAHLENYALKMFCIQIMKFMLGDFTKTWSSSTTLQVF